MDWRRPAEMLLKDIPREALMRPLSRNEVVGMMLRLTIFGAVTYYSIKWVVDAMDPTSKQKSQSKKRVYWTEALNISMSLLHYVSSRMMSLFVQVPAVSWALCLISPGRTADEEDRCWGGQTNRVWDEHCISPSWSADYEGNRCNPQPMTLRLSSVNLTIFYHCCFPYIYFFPVLYLLAGVLERHSRSGWGYKWVARHCHPALPEKTPVSWIQTLSASKRYRSMSSNQNYNGQVLHIMFMVHINYLLLDLKLQIDIWHYIIFSASRKYFWKWHNFVVLATTHSLFEM